MLRDVLPATWEVAGGRAVVGGVALGDLADRHGTPLYVMDEHHIRRRLGAFREAFPEAVLAFAAKSFFCRAMASVCAEEGWWADVVSRGEIRTALAGGLGPDRLLFHGNNKSREELELSAREGIGRVVVDHPGELALLDELALGHHTRIRVLVRLALDVRVDTHPKVRTSGPEAHFGMVPEVAARALDEAADRSGLEVVGVHVHLGSQLGDPGVFGSAAESLAAFVASRRSRFPEVPELDLGGGLAAPYLRGDPVLGPADLAAAVGPVLEEFGPHRLILEPGRWVVANAGITLYRIGVRKDLPTGGDVLAVDGGMSDNPRPALYGARYEALMADRPEDPHQHSFRVVGRHCETGDVLVPETRLPVDAGPGELLAVPATGAYTFVMSSRYNRIPRPPVVFAVGGRSRLVVRGETVEDLLAAEH